MNARSVPVEMLAPARTLKEATAASVLKASQDTTVTRVRFFVERGLQ